MIKHKLALSGIILFFITFLLMSCSKNNEIEIIIINENHKIFLNDIIIYKNYNVKIIDKESYWIIKDLNKEILLDFLAIVNLKLDIITDNIANANTTRTSYGGPFIRQYLKITQEDGMEILKDTQQNTRFVWDPTHPDSILTGEKKGLVEYPNVDVYIETLEQIEFARLKDVIIDCLKTKNIFVVY